jgi:hypothetical protein
MKIARLTETRLYTVLGLAFTAKFFVLRVVVSNIYFAKLAGIVLALQERPWWAWAGKGPAPALRCWASVCPITMLFWARSRQLQLAAAL